VEHLTFTGTDIEGITLNSYNSNFYIVEYKDKEVITVTQGGLGINNQPLNIPADTGPTGICIDDRGIYFVITGKNPGVIIELSENLLELNRYNIDFALDYTDICYDKYSEVFYIVSSKSKMLYVWSKDDGLLDSYEIDKTGFEGITINPATGELFLVNDSLNAMYQYKISNY
jgi:hypothetical protein